ncbi:MAG: PfkB family carbohydrate kinase [Polyangiaceae bacterium]
MPGSVVIWGELLWDRFLDEDRLGGAPANVAWHLGQAGEPARLVTRVGNDELGHRALAGVGDLVDTSLVQVDSERATGEVTVSLVEGEPRYVLHAGRAWERIACTADASRALAEAAWFVYGTLAQRTLEGLDGWSAAVASASGATKVCDVNLRKTWKPDGAIAPHAAELEAIWLAIEAADIVKVNDTELAVLSSWADWSDGIESLRTRGRPKKLVLLTHGARGSTLFGDGKPLAVAGFPARAGGDNVGCGDAFLALLLHGLRTGCELEGAARVASRWAAEVASVRGATPRFSPDLVARLLAPTGERE